MRDLVRFLAGLAADLLRGRTALVAENGLLRQQLIVAERRIVGRVRWLGRRGREWALVIAARIVHHEEMRSTFLWPVSIGLAALACDGSSVTSNSP